MLAPLYTNKKHVGLLNHLIIVITFLSDQSDPNKRRALYLSFWDQILPKLVTFGCSIISPNFTICWLKIEHYILGAQIFNNFSFIKTTLFYLILGNQSLLKILLYAKRKVWIIIGDNKTGKWYFYGFLSEPLYLLSTAVFFNLFWFAAPFRPSKKLVKNDNLAGP